MPGQNDCVFFCVGYLSLCIPDNTLIGKSFLQNVPRVVNPSVSKVARVGFRGDTGSKYDHLAQKVLFSSAPVAANHSRLR
jgi:hypothetical protein